MTCEGHDRGLALYVEGDLSQPETARLEQHLGECQRCREFLHALEDSQRKLKALAAEPVEDAALAVVRARVLAAVSQPVGSPWPMPAWGWALAAGLAVLALGLAFVWRTRPGPPQVATSMAHASPSPTVGPAHAETQGAALIGRVPITPASQGRGLPGVTTAAAFGRHSMARRDRAVSQTMESETALVVPELSPDDADQLAQAVVAVSRIRRLSDEPTAVRAAVSSPAMVRLETPDPDVVIYWQLDSNGG